MQPAVSSTHPLHPSWSPGSCSRSVSHACTVLRIDRRGSCIAGCVLPLPGLATSLLVTYIAYRIPMYTCCGLYLAFELSIYSLVWASGTAWSTLSKEFPVSTYCAVRLARIVSCFPPISQEYLGNICCTSSTEVCSDSYDCREVLLQPSLLLLPPPVWVENIRPCSVSAWSACAEPFKRTMLLHRPGLSSLLIFCQSFFASFDTFPYNEQRRAAIREDLFVKEEKPFEANKEKFFAMLWFAVV
jgi:hypothetical protein